LEIIMANILGPLIGAAIDRKDGDSGVKGAVIGSLAQSAVKAGVTVAITCAAGLAIKKLFGRSSGAA
jgi:hypothetical protein